MWFGTTETPPSEPMEEGSAENAASKDTDSAQPEEPQEAKSLKCDE